MPERTPPALLAPGDAVRFEPIGAEAFATIRSAVASGGYEAESGAARPMKGALKVLMPA